jgi:hypothetical protein
MEETKISYQTARLANLKGFDPNVKLKKNSHYSDLTEQLDSLGTSGAVVVHHYYAATQSLLQKWLREVHNIHIQVFPEDDVDLSRVWTTSLFQLNYGQDREVHWLSREKYTKSYEDGLEIGLFEALNLI